MKNHLADKKLSDTPEAGKRIELTIEKIIPGGDGLARKDGMTYFVSGVLPGEVVLAQPRKISKSWIKAVPVEILIPSPSRTEPFCRYYGVCGGCSWQHMSYESQIKAKISFTREALMRQGGFNKNNLPEIYIKKSPPKAYRSRIRPVIIEKGKSAGFRSSRSAETVEIKNCPVADDQINNFFCNIPGELNENDEPAVFSNGSRVYTEGLDNMAEVKIGSRRFIFPTGAFFQSNLLILEDLVAFALQGLKGSCALDLYGGSGLFGAFLSENFNCVAGVDRDRRTEETWKINVGERGHFYPVSLEKWIKYKIKEKPDLIVVDPPRGGLDKKVRQVLSGLKPEYLVYVSCSPVTQARDMKFFMENGYSLESFGLFDLYPQTPHVETAARLVYNGSIKNEK